jgi:glutamate---cysteine ligase / carboxylate-amine ligase
MDARTGRTLDKWPTPNDAGSWLMSGVVTAHWAEWSASEAYTLGVEEEVMLLDPADDWSLAQRIDDVLPGLSQRLGEQVDGETHGSAVELSTDPHAAVTEAMEQVRSLRAILSAELATAGLRTASAGTHPRAVWSEVRIAGGDRHQAVYGSMRELARREPTFALHVHIGVGDPERAIELYNRLRGHLALLLALAANSPFWQGRDTGLASARVPIFQAFPRVGIPRQFGDYSEYVETVDLLLRAQAFPEPTFLWWDVRPQPRFGTVEVRIMDAQTRVSATATLVALLQSIASLELEEGYLALGRLGSPEVLAENRFIATRDGVHARLIDPALERTVPVTEILGNLMSALAPHADRLGCRDALEDVAVLTRESGSDEQRRVHEELGSLPALVEFLADEFCAQGIGRRRGLPDGGAPLQTV